MGFCELPNNQPDLGCNNFKNIIYATTAESERTYSRCMRNKKQHANIEHI